MQQVTKDSDIGPNLHPTGGRCARPFPQSLTACEIQRSRLRMIGRQDITKG